jgi:hypothetical protein
MSWLFRVCTVSLAFGLAVVVLPSTASAQQTDMFPSGAAVTFKEGRRQLIRKEMGGSFVAGTEVETRRYFNMAHCVCSAEKPQLFSSTFAFELTMSTAVGTATQGQIWVGEPGAENACDLVDNRGPNREVCSATDEIIDDLDNDLFGEEYVVEMPTHQLLKVAGETCAERNVGSTVWVLANAMGGTGGTLDYGSSYTYDIDTKAPPIPADIKVSAVEGTIDISWDIDVGDSGDIESFQALCLTADNKPVLSEAKFERDFDTPATVCQSTAQPLVPSEAVTTGSNGPDVDGVFPGDLFTNDKYICAEATSGNGISISGLKNDNEYKVVVVVVDDSGNARAFYLDKSQVPIPATDAWEDLNDVPGYEVEGGFCLIAKTYGDGGGPTQALRAFRDETLASTAFGRWLIAAYYDHTAGLGALVAESAVARVIAAVVLLPAVALALAWHLVSLPGLLGLFGLTWAWRRRRRQQRSHRLLIASAATAALVAVPAIASAQSSIAPYWEDELIESEGEESADPVRWNVGIKVGPYTPGIDAQFQDQTDSTRKPFDEAFRGGMWLPVLEVDYFILNHIGQLGIGGSVGFGGDGANPWKVYDPELDPTPGSNDPPNPTLPGAANRQRENADDMSFRMVPLTLTAVYRATQLHDLYGIPVVPYARGGLAYYLWWMRSPNGEIAELNGCTGNLESTKCKGRGGSLGLVGSVGLALRAEGIDKEAALSMRESGIAHAGFYVEGSLGWVDGFGNEKRLALGDVTWFGGFNFEF